MTRQFASSVKVGFGAILLVVVSVACTPTGSPATAVVNQPPQPTSTLEPTLAPSPPPTDTPIAMPTDTPIREPTSTSGPRAGLSGRIFDQTTNQPIPAAQVSAGEQTATTTANGRYTLTGLEPGQYVLSVTHPDYDPGLSRISTLMGGQDRLLDLALYALETSPYPADPMLTNPVDPNGAPTEAEAIRLAQEQGLTGEVVNVEETTLTGDYLVNYKIDDDVRAAVAALNHEAWALTDEAGRTWWIIKVCGNLASLLPAQQPLPTPKPVSLPPLAEVIVDGLVARTCAAETCAEAGQIPLGERVELFGCLVEGSWCEVSWQGVRGWCPGPSLRQLAVATAIPAATPVLPTPIPTPPVVVASGGGKIVFVSYRDGSYGLDLIDPDGTNLTRLIFGQGAYMSPTWSPNGQQVAFARNDGDIYLINIDGSGLTRLTTHPADSVFRFPEWSPDGQRLAFTSSMDGGGIFTINIDGSGLTQLTKNHPWDTVFTWSPDGRQLAFHADFDSDSFPEIYLINADGSGQRQLTIGSEPAWSPDGQRLAFKSVPDGKNADVYLINIDGSGLTRLTDHPAWDTSPAWSPDGQSIVFTSERDNKGIYVMNADGTGLTRLTEGLEPDW